MKKRILSGIQPSGDLHIGNYIGALKQWVHLQNDYENFFCVVDHHAITVPQKPEELRRRTLEITKWYLAAGIDPEKSTIFVQSHVPAHTELAWILSTMTKIPEMERMTQFKDKSGKNKKSVNVGLFTYPILMAADILLYQANLVPVGEDQTQHLEFARTIGKRFNNAYDQAFTIPEQFTPPQGARVMSLANPENKMSKSDPKPSGMILLNDDADTIKRKIKKAVTDSGEEIVYSNKKPALKNLLTIYSTFSGQAIPEIVDHYKGTGYKVFKEGLAKTISEGLKPIQEKFQKLDNDPSLVHGILEKGAEKANLAAEATLHNVKHAVGYALK
jgi:tryptophanyl-tRNA synthetase